MPPTQEVDDDRAGTQVSTGVEQLDRALDGGYPRPRSVLLEGEPGTGKTTLAMQFLQAGLDSGDDCLFVSTEQTEAEVVDAFRSFPYDIDHENLTVVSLHVQTGQPTENFAGNSISRRFGGQGEEGFVLRTLEGGATIDEHQISFNGSNVRQYLARAGDCDRVVLDSVSGLSTMATDYEVFRRSVLDLIRLFSDTFEATSLFTSETGSAIDDRNLLRYNTHGVVTLTREPVAGSSKRYLRVEKMRGIDHDTRRYNLRIDAEYGVRLFPRNRTRDSEMNPHDVQPTGVEGLDDLLGGGVPKGAPSVVEHDGRADIDVMTAALLNQAVEDGFTVLLIAPPEWTCETLNRYLWVEETVESLMEANRLFAICGSERSDMLSENVYTFEESMTREDYFGILSEVRSRREGPWWTLVDIEAPMDFFTLEDTKAVWRQTAAGLVDENDVITCLTNSRRDNDDVREFLYDIAPQVIRFTQAADGLTFAHLDKSLTGQIGDAKIVDFPSTVPYVAFE